MIEDDRGCIDYAESGLGPTVVFVPGSCSTGSAWRPILSELGNGWRAVTTSLLGYGGTAERRTLRDADISREAEVLEAFRAGETAAIKLMIDFYGGAGTFAAWPERVRRYAVDTTPVNILDWASAYDFQLTPGCLANIDVPALVLRGGASHPAMRRASELLSQCMANASLATIAGAAHFMISTHAAQVAGAIAQHLAGVERSEKRSHPALALRH